MGKPDPWPLTPDAYTMFRLATAFREQDLMDTSFGHKPDGFLLWIDAVGGYRVCLGDEVILGQPSRHQAVDVPILGDLSSRHARIRRDGEGYLIEAIREVGVAGRPVRPVATLSDGSVIQLGRAVRLVFRCPHALSATARLDFASRHRTQPSADAVLLMADACVLGPGPHSHVVCPDWPAEVILYRHDDELYCRTTGVLEVDGVKHKKRSRIHRNSRIAADWFSINLEPL